nr:protein ACCUMULATION AND REPLICATION OF CHLOROPLASTS 3 [Ipomoea batatas]
METYLADNVSTFKLPVGVKQLEQSKNGSTTSNSWNWAEWMTEEIKRAQTQDTKDVSWDRVNSDSEAKLEMDNHASRVTQADQSNFSKKKGVLSIRAASMLESERASQKKWVPVVEMKYRGGIYRGHIQGGLPEGKAICLSEMEVFMMACGAMERGPALAPSTLVMVISTVVCGGMM